MSYWQKLGRAHQHLETIEQTVARFLEMKPCSLVGDYDHDPPFEEGEELSYSIRLHAPITPPEELSLLT